MSEHAVWAGLGTRPGTESPPDDTDYAPFEHRIVDAATAPSIVPPGAVSSPFAHPYQVAAGSAAPSAAKPAAARPPKETPMAKQDTERTTAPRNLQMRVGALLLDKGPMAKRAIQEEFADLTSKQLFQSLYQMKSAQRAKKVATPAGDVWQLTPFGKTWMNEGGSQRRAAVAIKHEESAAPPVKAKKPRAVKKTRAAKPVPAKRRIPGKRTQNLVHATGAIHPVPLTAADRRFSLVEERSFKCAVISDGGFFLAKGGTQIDLNPAEHAEMLKYLERMAEAQA